MKIYQQIARLAKHIKDTDGNPQYATYNESSRITLSAIERNLLPNGNGFNRIPRVAVEQCSGERLVIHGSYQCMNENGFYDGWASFTVKIKPCLTDGIKVAVTASNKESGRLLTMYNLREYIAECYAFSLEGEL